jgi:hypothetical protein
MLEFFGHAAAEQIGLGANGVERHEIPRYSNYRRAETCPYTKSESSGIVRRLFNKNCCLILSPLRELDRHSGQSLDP